MAKIPFLEPFFHFGGHFSAISGRGPFSIFFPIFPGFLRRTGFPFCRWPPHMQHIPLVKPLVFTMPLVFIGRQKGGFAEGWFWRMYPRSSSYPRCGFRSGGSSKYTLVAVCVPGEHPPKLPFWKTTLSFHSLSFSSERSSFFFERFALLFQGFEGCGGDKKSLCFGGFSLPFFPKKRKGRTGHPFVNPRSLQLCTLVLICCRGACLAGWWGPVLDCMSSTAQGQRRHSVCAHLLCSSSLWGKSNWGLTNGGLSPKFERKSGKIRPFGTHWSLFRADWRLLGQAPIC